MLGKKQSSCVGFNPFSKYPKEKSSISTKIINKLKSFFQINLNPSSCIQREIISQQTIYVPINSEIIGAQTIEQDSIHIQNSQSSQRQKRNKFTSFDDHLKEQQSIIVQENDIGSKVYQKEEKHLRKLNSKKSSYDPVLPEDIDKEEIKDKEIIQHRRKLSSQQYKKRKLDEKKKAVEIKFVYKKHIKDQIQDINESRIQEVPEQISDDSLKNNSLLAGGGLKNEQLKKEIIIVQLKDDKPIQPEPPMLTINEIIEHQSKGLKKSQSMINLNEQEGKSYSCSPKKLENPQSRKQSDVLSKLNEPKQSELQKEQPIVEQQQEEKIQVDQKIKSQLQPQQTVINFIVQGPTKLDKPQTTSSSIFNILQKEVIEDKKPQEQQEKNVNNFSDTPLFGIFKNSEGLQGQIPPSKINVQSSLFATNDSKDLNQQQQQQSSDQSSGQNLQQNQFTFLQNKPNNQEPTQQPSNSESSGSNVNNKKDTQDQQPKIEENNNQIYSLFNNTTTATQNDQFNANDQFRTKKQLFQNFINVPQSIQGEQNEEKKQDQVVENQEIQKKPEEQKQISLFPGINFQIPEIKNQVDNNINQNNKESSILQLPSFFNKQSNDNNNNKEIQPVSLLFGGAQNEKEKLETKVEYQPPFLNGVNSIQINKSQENKDKETPNPSLFTSLLKFENKTNADTPKNQEVKLSQNNSQKQEILTPLHNSMGLNCQWKSSSDDQKNNQFNINSEPKPAEQQKQSPFAFLQKQIPQSENVKSDNLSSDPIIKSAATPVKQIDNPFLQQSPKIDQEQINSYFSNNSQSRTPQEEPAKVQTSLFQNNLFQPNAQSMFALPVQPQQSQNSFIPFQQNPQLNQFQQQNSLFQFGANTNINTNINLNNRSMCNEMEITDMSQPPQQFQFGQQQILTQNTYGQFNQPQIGTNGFLQQIQSQPQNVSALQYFQKNTFQQNDLSMQLFQPPVNQQSSGLFQQDPPKTTNQSQSLNSSFQSKNGKKKQRI